MTSAPAPVPSLEEALGGHAFFKGLPAGLLRAAATTAMERSFRAGSTSCGRGGPPGSCSPSWTGRSRSRSTPRIGFA